MSRRRWLIAALSGWAILALPPVRDGLEATLTGHMVVQLPLLVIVGWWLGTAMGPLSQQGLNSLNRHGVTGLLLAAFTLAFWLLPRSLDAALQEPAWETAKFLSLPLLAGAPLSRSWPRLPVVARAAIQANLIPMLWVMGWLYIESPVRLCNNYLLDQQLILGRTLWILAAMIGVYWAVRAFTGKPGMARHSAST